METNNPFPKGAPVRVSNGEPKPPAHHKRKLGLWQTRNFDGFVHREAEYSVGQWQIGVRPTLGSSLVWMVPLSHVTAREVQS